MTIKRANLLWAKIKDKYASKRAVNRGRVWMDCKEVSTMATYKITSTRGDANLHQFVKNLTLNEDIIKKPNRILACLQDLAHLRIVEKKGQITSPTALVSNVEEPHKVVYYCVKGKHNIKCATHKKEDCWSRNPHLRPPRREKKCRHFDATAHLTIAQALMTISKQKSAHIRLRSHQPYV
ncbi:hypothetical protein O181_070788 [Austropuccinia psidii MF-1]|uniref:Uncharacterized protein n=1 Tax=Austropuccinia psidii MF-1 TaxID=1389203 RepID=A0A9Q3F4J7_9BASI|nr:hypothetical protein [Austropuccinia psidii MF-1]